LTTIFAAGNYTQVHLLQLKTPLVALCFSIKITTSAVRLIPVVSLLPPTASVAAAVPAPLAGLHNRTPAVYCYVTNRLTNTSVTWLPPTAGVPGAAPDPFGRPPLFVYIDHQRLQLADWPAGNGTVILVDVTDAETPVVPGDEVCLLCEERPVGSFGLVSSCSGCQVLVGFVKLHVLHSGLDRLQ
jgi:hypothetical protein